MRRGVGVAPNVSRRSVYGCLLAIALVTAACDRRDERRTTPEPSAPVAVEAPQPLEPEVACRRGRRAGVGARRLAVVARLAELVDPSDGPIVGSRCPIDEERRPLFSDA